MGRRKKSGLDEVASWPWPLGILAGVIAFVVLRFGIGAYLSAAGGAVLGPVGQQIGGMLEPLAWMVLVACWVAAGASWMKSRKRRHLHETRTDVDSLRAISWQEFEMLVGESYRRQGYEVLENGLGGRDGGIDLILSKGGRRELVQCKQWKRRQVDVATVREMWGLVEHHHADAVHIVSAGNFTGDAARFAEGKPIHLVTGQAFVERIRKAKADNAIGSSGPPPTDPAEPACPMCSGAMAGRQNRRTGERFWGCARFPQCRGTVPIRA